MTMTHGTVVFRASASVMLSCVAAFTVAADTQPVAPPRARECPDLPFVVNIPRGTPAFDTLLLLDLQSGCRHNFGVATPIEPNVTLGPLTEQYRYLKAIE